MSVRPNSQEDIAHTLRALGNRIAEERAFLRLSLRALENLSGVSNARISQIERGGNASVATIYRIAWSLGIQPRHLFPDHLQTAVVGRKISRQ